MRRGDRGSKARCGASQRGVGIHVPPVHRSDDRVLQDLWRGNLQLLDYLFRHAKRDGHHKKPVPENHVLGNGLLQSRKVLEPPLQSLQLRDDLNRLVEMFPDSALAYAARAGFEQEQEQYDAALYDWDEALRLRPNDASLTVSKVDVLLNLGRIREAREALDKAVKQGTTRAALREWYDKCK